MKYILSFFILAITLIGCGGSNDGASSKNPFNTKSFNPYTDAGFDYAWHLRVVDRELAKARNITDDSNIHIYSAWEKTRGENVKIAIIDYDFNSKNKDLAENIYTTYDISTNTTDVIKNYDSHGTACASIIASPQNGIGIIGVAPKSKLILISANLDIENERILALKKAKQLGAQVVSCSWGFGLTQGISTQIKNTLKDLYDNGITVIFSSGNNSIDLDIDPNYTDESELPWVIGVGASTEENKKEPHSNYGSNIDILAPGGNQNGGIYCIKGYVDSSYGYFNGTSAASSVVAGVVALIKSVNPKLTPRQIREILITTADKIEPEVANYDPYTGFSHTHAYGKVNASAAVAKALDY
jgi:subtilisin family serine protease